MGLPQIWQTLFGTGSKLVSGIIPFGTKAGEVMAGDDSRVTKAVPNTRKVLTEAGLFGGGVLDADIKLSLDMGYDPTKDYRKPCAIFGADGQLYAWQQASGPGVASVGVKEPGKPGSDGFWNATMFRSVQNGTGIGQSNSAVKIGWSNSGQLRLTVDQTDLGYIPHTLTGALYHYAPSAGTVNPDTTVGIAWGGSGMRYTATKDCIFWVNFASTGPGYMSLSVLGGGGATAYADSVVMQGAGGGDVWVPVMKGFRVSVGTNIASFSSPPSVRVATFNGAA